MEEAGEQRRMSKKGTVMRVVHGDEAGLRRVEKVAVPETRRPDTIRYVERKLCEKGLHRLDRHPVHGGYGPHKSGHCGKYTWEGPDDLAQAELDPAPAAIDEGDPNYERLSGEVGGAASAGEEEEEEQGGGMVVSEVEVAKVAESREGVSRIEVLPPL